MLLIIPCLCNKGAVSVAGWFDAKNISNKKYTGFLFIYLLFISLFNFNFLFTPICLFIYSFICCWQGVDGATTVASTSYLASLAGVKVFVTGGMGGVHRGAETTFDVSADLAELAQTPIVVVCAGVKSILDVEKTLEVLYGRVWRHCFLAVI